MLTKLKEVVEKPWKTMYKQNGNINKQIENQKINQKNPGPEKHKN